VGAKGNDRTTATAPINQQQEDQWHGQTGKRVNLKENKAQKMTFGFVSATATLK